MKIGCTNYSMEMLLLYLSWKQTCRSWCCLLVSMLKWRQDIQMIWWPNYQMTKWPGWQEASQTIDWMVYFVLYRCPFPCKLNQNNYILMAVHAVSPWSLHLPVVEHEIMTPTINTQIFSWNIKIKLNIHDYVSIFI